MEDLCPRPVRKCRSITSIATNTNDPAAESASALSAAELDAIEAELAQVERTLQLVADDDVDPTAALSWLPDSPA